MLAATAVHQLREALAAVLTELGAQLSDGDPIHWDTAPDDRPERVPPATTEAVALAIPSRDLR